LVSDAVALRRAYLGAAIALGVAFTAWWAWPTVPPALERTHEVPLASSAQPSSESSIVAAPAATAERSVATLAANTIWQDTPLPEDDYLKQLSALNRTDKSAALLLVEKGEQWYPDKGRAAEARRAMRITLLVDLGRMPEARSFTREFIASYPESAYRPLVQGVTGIHPRPSGPKR
jgi:hypothetical protein